MVEKLAKAREPMEQIALALLHPVRIRILSLAAENALSPIEFSRTTGTPLHTSAYHCDPQADRTLEGDDRVLSRRHRRGAQRRGLRRSRRLPLLLVPGRRRRAGLGRTDAGRRHPLDAATKIKEAADLRLLCSGEKPIRVIYSGAAFETSRPSERATAD